MTLIAALLRAVAQIIDIGGQGAFLTLPDERGVPIRAAGPIGVA